MAQFQAIEWVLLSVVFGCFVYERLYRAVCPRHAYPEQDTGINAAIALSVFVVFLSLSPFLR